MRPVVTGGIDDTAQRQQAIDRRHDGLAIGQQLVAERQIDRQDILVDRDPGLCRRRINGQVEVHLAALETSLGQVAAMPFNGFEALRITIFDVQVTTVDAADFQSPGKVAMAAFDAGKARHARQAHRFDLLFPPKVTARSLGCGLTSATVAEAEDDADAEDPKAGVE